MFFNYRSKSLFHRAWLALERACKELLFGCSSCGQCILRTTALTCPMRCPKQIRNGPCGGSVNGKCEAFEGRACVWHVIVKRQARVSYFRKKMNYNQPSVDWSLWGTSAWLNMFNKKIDSNGHALSDSPDVNKKR